MMPMPSIRASYRGVTPAVYAMAEKAVGGKDPILVDELRWYVWKIEKEIIYSSREPPPYTYRVDLILDERDRVVFELLQLYPGSMPHIDQWRGTR